MFWLKISPGQKIKIIKIMYQSCHESPWKSCNRNFYNRDVTIYHAMINLDYIYDESN